jgi:hypothetical protein
MQPTLIYQQMLTEGAFYISQNPYLIRMNLEYHPKGNFGGELEFFSFISDIMKR